MAGYIGSKAVITSGVSASIDELNIIDGVTATTAELNILDGVTSTAAELNILDGVTSTAAELNILDGVTATATELNLIDGVTSTTAELNILDGVTTTAAEINLIDGGTARGTTAIADGDGVLINDAGTMRQTSVETLATYMGTKGLGPSYTRSDTPPSSPNAGDWWIDTLRTTTVFPANHLYIYDSTFGWLSNRNDRPYIVAGSFSIQFAAGSLTRIPFEGTALGVQNAIGTGKTLYNLAGSGSWALSNSVRGVFSGNNAVVDTMAFITMASNAASQDFGNLNVARSNMPICTSHETRGIIAGGEDASDKTNVMDYITIASAGNASDFGNLTVARRDLPSQAMSSTTRSVFAGGQLSSIVNTMDYVTIANTGNATDFGDLTAVNDYGACVNSTTRGVTAGGTGSSREAKIDFITIGTAGNAGDFGDLIAGTNTRTAYHSATIGYFHAGAEQVTMATAANATASGYVMGDDSINTSVMPGWLAYNG